MTETPDLSPDADPGEPGEPGTSTPAALRHAMASAGAVWMPFGPPIREDGRAVQHEAADHFGHVEAEYAALRRHVGIMHLPWRRVIELSGADVRDFLHRLMTQDLKSMTGGQSRRSLLLDEKGHVLADTVVHFGDASTWIELDAFDAQPLIDKLDAVLFGEDATLHGVTLHDDDGEVVPGRQCFALLGPAAVTLLEAVRVTQDDEAGRPPLTQAGVHQVVRMNTSDDADAPRHVPVTVSRSETTGGIGLNVWVRAEHAAAVYRTLLDAAGFEAVDLDADKLTDDEAAAFAERRRSGLRGRPVGWSAYNTARVEAGTPMYHIDFGPDCVPAEAGLVDVAVSFTKGCYVGQEAVARMKNLGHPKKLLVGLRLPGADIPAAGTQVFDGKDGATVIGAVTSSAVSPMRGQQGVAIAMVRWGKQEPGTEVVVVAEGQKVTATVSALDRLG